MGVFQRAFRYYRPFMPETIFGASLTLAGIAVNLLKPWPFKIIVDDILPGNPTHDFFKRYLAATDAKTAILVLSASLVAIHFVGGLLNLANNITFIRVGLQSLFKLRTELYAYLQALPLKFHDSRRTADSSFRVAYDSQSIQTIYNRATAVFSSTLTLVGTLLIMLAMDWQLTAVALLVLPPLLWSIHHFAESVRKESTTIQERESEVLTVVQEGLSSIRMIQAFGREDFEVDQLRQKASGSLAANMRLTVTTMKGSLVTGTLMALGTAAMSGIGALHVLSGELSLGELLVLSAYLASLYQPIEALTYIIWALQGASAGAKRCFEVLDRIDDVPDREDPIELPTATGTLAFEAIRFGYDPDRPILNGIDLAVRPGQTVAFVGGTGAGKTSLLSLVPRFYDPTGGRILIDGHDLRAISKRSLRAQISIVLQDTLLFSTTVRENIAYGRPDAMDAEIEEAARRAQAHEFIAALPSGYHSQVGERGGHLSVGQRQRIGIARAFLKNAPILLLDEPTSALDPNTESAIMETIKELMRGRTTLIITHRIGTIHGMDQIAVLSEGKVAELGTGPELVAKGGLYARLYASAGHSETV
jgi:ATP-binding cassette subfamily B protein/subfamily B ATP-binding cassette protein MsbA